MCVYYSLVLEQELYPGELRTQYRTKALCSQHDFLRDMEVFMGSDKAPVCLFLTSQSKLSHVRLQDQDRGKDEYRTQHHGRLFPSRKLCVPPSVSASPHISLNRCPALCQSRKNWPAAATEAMPTVRWTAVDTALSTKTSHSYQQHARSSARGHAALS